MSDDHNRVLLNDSIIVGLCFFLSLRSGEGYKPLRINGAKVAAERYDPDDGLVRDSPPLEAQKVNLTPTPSPDYYPSSESSDHSPDPKGRKRPKPQPSQGDAVLINFMGGLNHPELATRAAEEPLPLSDDSEFEGDSMEVDNVTREDSKRADLVRLAGNALPFTEKRDDQGNDRENDRENALKIENWRPQRPTVLTESKHSPPNERLHSDEYKEQLIHKTSGHNMYEEHSERTMSRAATDGLTLLSRDGSRVGNAKSPSRSPNILNDDDSVSNVMRRNTLPASQHSRTETLPPLQPQASPANSAKSPNSLESLPSLAQSNLTCLLKSKLPPDSRYKDLGMPQIPISKTLNSPPLGSMASKASTSYSSPRPRMNSAFGPTFSHGHPSPVPSDASPRDSAAMSPPDRPGSLQFPQFQFGARSSQNEELTPQSAHSCPSSGSYSTAPSPQIGGEQMEVDRAGRILPPLVPHPGPPLMTGAFKCEYQGCTAQPFQTQYLLR